MKLIFQKNYIGDDSSQGTQEDMLVQIPLHKQEHEKAIEKILQQKQMGSDIKLKESF